MATLERIPAETARDEGLRCSFCSREPSAGSDLISGGDAFIFAMKVLVAADLAYRRAVAEDAGREMEL